MRLDNDFDDNIKELSKYAIIVCCVAIVIWFIISIVKLIKPEEIIPQKNMIKENTKIEDTLSKLVDESADSDEIQFEKEEAKIQRAGNKNFVLYVSELPDNVYFTRVYTPEKILNERRALINKKVGENYIDSVLSFGTLVRWNPDSFPLKVYIKLEKDVPEFHEQEIKNAFQKWEEATQGFISFTYIDSPDNADIICSYPPNFHNSCSSNAMSTTSKQYFTYDKEGNIIRSNIEFCTTDCNGEPYAQDMIYAIALREIGHALGLRGHSGNSKDNVLYYPEANRDKSVRPIINRSDINTLRLIYSIRPDKINTDLTAEQRAKLISPDEVWGERFDRTAVSEKAMLYNLEMAPEIPDLYVSLANYYKEKEEYDKAITAYSRSIVIMNDAEMKSKVYARVGDTYNLQDRYSEAIEAYKLSLKNTGDNSKGLFDIYFNLGVIYFKQGKNSDAIENFQNALKYVYDKENSYRLLVNMAELYLKTGNYINGMKCAEKAYSIKKGSSSRYLYAYSKYKNSEYKDAQVILEEGLKEEAPARMYALLAQIYYETQQYDALETLASKIKAEFPDKVIFTFK